MSEIGRNSLPERDQQPKTDSEAIGVSVQGNGSETVSLHGFPFTPQGSLKSWTTFQGGQLLASVPRPLGWGIAIKSEETTRYEQKTQAEAQELYDAIADNLDGVLPWIRRYW